MSTVIQVATIVITELRKEGIKFLMHPSITLQFNPLCMTERVRLDYWTMANM